MINRQIESRPKKRVYLLTHEEKIYYPRFFDRMLFACPKDTEVVGAALVSRGAWNGDLYRRIYRIDGVAGFARLLGSYFPRFLLRRCHTPRLSSVKRLLAHHRIPVEEVSSPNDPAFLDRLEERGIDVIFSAVLNILGDRILSIPRNGCVNRHTGRLPDFRGLEPVFHALRQGEESVTVTFHAMDAGIDTGDVLWECSIPVEPKDSCNRIVECLLEESAEGTWKAIENLTAGNRRPLDTSRGQYFSWPTADQIREFRSLGHRYT